ncbi:hypothetical protein LTR03_017511, partial [Friedmanniomyces endolithicus]
EPPLAEPEPEPEPVLEPVPEPLLLEEVEDDVFSFEPPEEEEDVFSPESPVEPLPPEELEEDVSWLEPPVAPAPDWMLPLPPLDEDKDPPTSPWASSSLACRSTAAGNSVAPDVSVLFVFVPAED